MNRKVKAFTLIELIVVIAIFGIIMAGLMNFYKPLRATYLDSTMYEEMRTSQDGILEYLCENTRYAEKLSMYDEGATVPKDDLPSYGSNMTITSPTAAYKAFVDANSLSGSDLKRVQIIVINRSTEYNAQGYIATSEPTTKRFTGRLITNILRTGDHDSPTADGFDARGARTLSSSASGDTYMALGGGYYGESNYDIFVDYEKTFGASGDSYAGGITFAVQNGLRNTGNIVTGDAVYGDSTVTVNADGSTVFLTSYQSNRTLNLSSGFTYYTLASKTPAGSFGADGKISGGNKDTYIVFITPDEAR
jgi:prepilin-type N-terminal cleavage/methylation domain-containing protein